LKRHFAPVFCALFAVLALLPLQPAAAQTSYSFQDLGPSGYNSFAYGVNDLGQVVGRVEVTNGANAVLWLPSPAYGLHAGMNTLKALAGYSDAQSINNSGEVVGNGGDGNAFLWLPEDRYSLSGGVNDLNTVLSRIGITTFHLMQAYKINANHQVTGNARYLLNNTDHAYVLDLNTYTFTDLGASMTGKGINNQAAPQVVGGSWMYSFFDSSYTSLSSLYAGSVNDAGEIIGWTPSGGKNYPAYRNAAGTVTNLGSFGGSGGNAAAINNAGVNAAVVVGYALTRQGIANAFRWQVGSAAKDNLNSLVSLPKGFTLWEALGISDSGYIVGYGGGTISSGTNKGSSYYHAVLLTPQ